MLECLGDDEVRGCVIFGFADLFEAGFFAEFLQTGGEFQFGRAFKVGAGFIRKDAAGLDEDAVGRAAVARGVLWRFVPALGEDGLFPRIDQFPSEGAECECGFGFDSGFAQEVLKGIDVLPLGLGGEDFGWRGLVGVVRGLDLAECGAALGAQAGLFFERVPTASVDLATGGKRGGEAGIRQLGEGAVMHFALVADAGVEFGPVPIVPDDGGIAFAVERHQFCGVRFHGSGCCLICGVLVKGVILTGLPLSKQDRDLAASLEFLAAIWCLR